MLTNLKTYRAETLSLLAEAITGDQFNDVAQIDTKGDMDDVTLDFLRRNVKGSLDTILECGPGTGRLIPSGFRFGYYLEPSATMLEGLRITAAGHAASGDSTPDMRQGVIEYIPWDNTFSSIVFWNGFFQVRSDYEALIEVNQHLQMLGTFVFNLYTRDESDIVSGRVLGMHNYLRLLDSFGFRVVEARDDGGEAMIAVQKVKQFEPAMLRKIQFVEQEDGLYKAVNVLMDRDFHLF